MIKRKKSKNLNQLLDLINLKRNKEKLTNYSKAMFQVKNRPLNHQRKSEERISLPFLRLI